MSALSQVAEPVVSPSPVSRGLSVVVAAAHSREAEALTLTLEAVGCDVASAGCGMAAVDLTQLVQPDVVLIVAGGPGWEAIPKAIADRAGWRKPFVLAITQPGEPEPGPDSGVHLSYPRPVSTDVLAAIIRRFRRLLSGVDGFDPAI